MILNTDTIVIHNHQTTIFMFFPCVSFSNFRGICVSCSILVKKLSSVWWVWVISSFRALQKVRSFYLSQSYRNSAGQTKPQKVQTLANIWIHENNSIMLKNSLNLQKKRKNIINLNKVKHTNSLSNPAENRQGEDAS